ncbi:MAG: two-component system, OmpR family, response regulator [bacterium]|jgi:two-component system OmpR family response regulator
MMCPVRVLVVEDEVELARLIRRGLMADGQLADIAASGEDALWMAAVTPYTAICLDVNLPGIDGFETCRRLRADAVATPIIMLTAREAVDDRITGLNAGADDYLVKPFAFGELLARLHALARRPGDRTGDVLQVGDLTFDPVRHHVRRAGQDLDLSLKEMQVLEVFMRHPGEVLSRLRLLEGAWDSGYENRSNVIDVYVRTLREKIDRPFGLDTLETVRGAGYRLRAA